MRTTTSSARLGRNNIICVHRAAAFRGSTRRRGSVRGLRFYCGVLRWIAAVFTFLLRRFAFGSRLSFFLFQEKRDGLRYAPFLFRRGSGSPVVRSRMSCGYPTSSVHFGFVRLFVAISTGLPGMRGTGSGAGGAAFVRLCAATLVLLCFPRGVRWGCAPQTCAKESSTLWTLFTLRRGCLSAYTRRHPGTRKDPPESNLCSGGSGCIAILPIRTIVQTRSAPKR